MADFLPARRVDHLGLRAGLADLLLPVLVAAMSFLGALTLGGSMAAATLAAHWQGDSATALTIQVPAPEDAAVGGGMSRVAAVLAAARAMPDVADATLLSRAEVNRLLAPWLGADVAALDLPVPAVISASWTGAVDPGALAAALALRAPGTLVSTGAAWAARVAALARSLQACAAAVLVVVAAVAAAVVAVATRAGLAQRREAIEIVHGLGALDADIADRFAARALSLAAAGAAGGALLALPALFWLASLAAPFAGAAPAAGGGLPASLWMALPALPLAAAGIGWGTAQLTVRGWLRRLA
jgi:cell division transport system permease protein